MIDYREESQGVISICLHTPADCEQTVRRLKQLQGWEPAQVRDGFSEPITQPDVRSTRILLCAEVEELYRPFEAALNKTLKPLIKQVWRLGFTYYSGTQILRYGPADHYVPHQDTGPGFESRYFSVVCYLNDDFAGGDSSFPGLNYTAKPVAGKAIVFPSHYLHASVPVVTGEKFVIVSWLRGPEPIKWI